MDLLQKVFEPKNSISRFNYKNFGKYTFLKCVAHCSFLIGCIRASLTTTAISDPEYLMHG
jgi:hypothetical protein